MPSLKLSARSIVPHLQLQTFKTSMSALASGATFSITSNTIQLSQIPDSVLICVRKVPGNKASGDTDSYLPLAGVAGTQGSLSINFNNQPGILASATNEQLFSMSCEAGVNQTWREFAGNASISPPFDFTAGNAIARTAVGGAGLNPVATIGPLIKLDFNRHIPVAADWYSSGSIGSFNFQATMKVYNNTGANILQNAYELCVLFVNSGIIVNSLGATSSYLGVLSKEAVLEAAEKPPINKGGYERVYGGSWWSNLKAGISKNAKYAKPLASLAKNLLANSDSARGKKAAAALGALGAGYSAGGKFNGRIY
jgi:hypothetical protein